MNEPEPKTTSEATPAGAQDRREFLETCGRFATITPPAVVLLLSTAMTSDAIAKSGGGNGGGGGGGGGGPGGGLGGLIDWILGLFGRGR